MRQIRPQSYQKLSHKPYLSQFLFLYVQLLLTPIPLQSFVLLILNLPQHFLQFKTANRPAFYVVYHNFVKLQRVAYYLNPKCLPA